MFNMLLSLAFMAPGADYPGACRVAALDISNPKQVAPFLQTDTRYFDFSDAPPDQLELFIAVFCGHVNGLSRNARIVIPVRISKYVLRVCISDYHWKRATFESLKDVDPYYHTSVYKEVKAGQKWPGGIWYVDGKYYPASDEVMQNDVKIKKRVGAVQLHSAEEVTLLLGKKIKEENTAIGTLYTLTHSEIPILDGVWFVQQTMADFNRKPGYHDFLDFKDQDEFEKLVGFDEKTSRKFSDLWREAVSRSKVLAGSGARRVEVLDALGGSYYRTKDSNLKTDRRNPLRVVNDDLEFDATEAFGSLPNRFFAWGLFDNKRVRQDNAPDKVVGWPDGVNNDTKLHNNIACISCHKNAGVHELNGFFRKLFLPPKGLESADYAQLLQLTREYLEPLDDLFSSSRTSYARAIFRASGLTPAEWSRGNYLLWKHYVGAKVDRKWAARSLGTCPGDMQEAFHRIKATTGYIDPVLATFLEPESDPIAIDAWEEVFPIAQSYLRGVSP